VSNVENCDKFIKVLNEIRTAIEKL
jgi:hypothetical protein